MEPPRQPIDFIRTSQRLKIWVEQVVVHNRYIYLKRKTYYFVSRVPKALQHHYTTNKIQVCLHTDQELVAIRQAAQLRM